jgi:ABC-type transport system involved in cytochrome c biogenesis permease component
VSLLRKAVAITRRRGGGLLAVALFVPLAQGIVYLALDPSPERRTAALIGAVWVCLLFAALWLVEELLQEEWATGAVQQYVLAGAEHRFFWDAFLLATVGICGLGALAWGAGAVLFSVDLYGQLGPLVVSTVIFAAGIAGLSVLVRQITHAAGTGSLLAPLLLFPLTAPLLLASVQASRAVLVTAESPDRWMLLGTFFGIMYTLLGSLSIPHLLKE